MKVLILVAIIAVASAHPVDINQRFEKVNAKFDQKYAEFEVMTPEEQIQVIEKIKAKLPAPIQEKLAALGDDQNTKIIEKFEKFHALSTEERQVVFQKVFAHVRSMMAQPDFRQKMKQRFDSLTPEQQEEVKNHIHRRYSDGAVAYAASAQTGVDRFPPRNRPIDRIPVNEEPALRERHPRPQGFEPIRKVQDDIMLSGQWA